MNPEQTGKSYDTITDHWSDDRFNMKNGLDQHGRAISFVKSRGKALDVGCGRTGRIMDLLAVEGFTPEGLDVSGGMIALARDRNPDWKFYREDICTFQLPDRYSFITAWDSIWHVPLDEQVNVMSKLIGALIPDGIMIFSFGGINEPGSRSDDTMGPLMYYSSLGTNGLIRLLLDHACTIKHLEFDQHPELHAYMIVQKIA